MTITSISNAKFLADSVNLIRNLLTTNITDPIASKRTGNEKFVMTSYPQRPVKYPIITVVDRDITQPRKMGMGSESFILILTIEIRIWARNIVERDELFDEIFSYFQGHQYTTTSLVDAHINEWTLDSVVNISEEGEAGIKSKVLQYKFMFVSS
jgi:hypothetical protein